MLFSQAMLHELKANEHKGDWRLLSDAESAQEVLYHAEKLLIALRHQHPEAILEYAADTANCAMMAAHSAGALDTGWLSRIPAEQMPGVTWGYQLPGVKARSMRRARRTLGDPEAWAETIAWALKDYRKRAGRKARALLRERV